MRVAALALTIGCLFSGTAVADTTSGWVVGVSDGDTITVLGADNNRLKVRLAGIDAPEKKQAFGQRSKEHLSSLVYGREVMLDCGKLDRYGREVCVVLLGERDVNLEQVRAGLAWWYRQYSREQSPMRRAAYERAERDAQESRVGLWKDVSPIPPWEWRHGGGRLKLN